jgi:hypothetical protein
MGGFGLEVGMSRSLLRSITMLVFSLLALACARLEPGSSACPCDGKDRRGSAPELSAERLMLSEGYSLLYHDASSLDRSEWILYGKFESDAMDELVTAVADLGGELGAELERIDRDYPGVRIDLDPLPEIEKRKRWAIGKDRALYFAPGIGHSGREYERTVLIGLMNGINHERHMCQVMAEAEPDAGLKKFLIDVEKRYDRMHDRIVALLVAEYFVDPDGESR